jgi:hypothetical protein
LFTLDLRIDEFKGTAAVPNRRFYSEKDKLAPVNWRRGLFRLWVLASVAWMMGWIIFFAIGFVGGESTARDLLVLSVVLIGPPIALLLLGIATRWAFQGFNDE